MIRELKESDIFMNELNKNNVVFNKLNLILSNAIPSTVILNQILYPEIKRKIVDKRKDSISMEIATAIAQGSLVLFTIAPDKKLSDMIPFFAYTQNGVRKVAVNLCSMVRVNRLDDNSQDYEMGDHVDQIYAVLVASWLTLTKFDKKAVVTPGVMENAAVLWAEMFTKPLFDVVGLNNIDRKNAFMYFSIRFFLGYFLGISKDSIDSISLKYVGTKNSLILYMEDKIEHLGLDMYAGVIPFLKILLNNEVSMVKGMRVNNIDNSMNISFYMTKFSQTFGSNALLSLCAFPYFIYTVMAAASKTRMVKDKAFDRIFSGHNSKALNKLIIDVQKM